MDNVIHQNCAPIIIPTLNRKNHLERCILSLANNSWSIYTDIIISVDFPPSEKYVDGYNDVKKFLLDDGEWKGRFKNVEIHIQERNLGAINNYLFMRNIVKLKYKLNKCIISEDDNEFSPNFLEYINIGLEKYYNKKNVIAICSCKETNWYCKKQDTVIASKIFPAYGVGIWLDKEDVLQSHINELLSKKYVNIRSLMKIRKQNRALFSMYILRILLDESAPFWKDGNLVTIDTVKSIYLHMTDNVCVLPTISKSRTWGNDGSGANMAAIKNYNPAKECVLDSNAHFDFVTQSDKLEFYDENYKIGNNYMKLPDGKIGYLKADIGFVVLMICGFDRNRAVKLLSKRKTK